MKMRYGIRFFETYVFLSGTAEGKYNLVQVHISVSFGQWCGETPRVQKQTNPVIYFSDVVHKPHL